MRNLLLASIAVVLLPAAAHADDITLKASVDGVLVDTIDSGGLPTLNVTNVAFGPSFNLNTLTLNSQGALAAPDILDTNALDVDHNGGSAHALVLDITATGLTGTGVLQALLSEFSVTGLTPGWTIQEATKINGNPLSSTPVFTGNSASADVTAAALLTNPFTAEVIYTLTASATAGQFNGGIDIKAAGAPGPVLGSSLPGMLATVLFGGFMYWRRKLAFSVMP